MPGPRKKAPPPLQVDTGRVVLAGTGVWVIALVVLLLMGDRVDPLWPRTAAAAIALAVLGLGIMRWQGRSGRPSRPEGDPRP